MRSIWSSIVAARIGAKWCCSSSDRLDKTKPAAGSVPAAGPLICAGWPAPPQPASGLGDVDVLGFREEQEADDEAHDGDADRIPQTGIDVAGRGNDCEHGRRQEAAEPAVANVVGQRHA